MLNITTLPAKTSASTGSEASVPQKGPEASLLLDDQSVYSMFALKLWQSILLLFIIAITQNIAYAQQARLSDNIKTASCTSPLQEVPPASLFNSQHSKTTPISTTCTTTE